jgi:hypothetical protein
VLPGSPLPAARAIAIPGHFANDVYRPDPTVFVFSCAGGVAAKCSGWGYSPGQNFSGPTLENDPKNPKPPTHATRQYWGTQMFGVCTRMARADYCADGVSHTLDGTPIISYDIFKYNRRTNPVPRFAFEAAWGVKQLPSGDWDLGVICLSQLRWERFPLNPFCPAKLPDPRLSPSGQDPNLPHFCEDLDGALLATNQDLPMVFETALEDQGAVIYNDSANLDVGLIAWIDPVTQNRLTTTKLIPGHAGDTPLIRPGFVWPSGAPFPSLPPSKSMQFEGAISSADSAFPQINQGLVPLVSYACPGPLYVTTTQSPPPAGCVQIAIEGYVSPVPAGKPLLRWLDSTGQWVTSSTLTPTLAPILEGYLPH